MSKYYKRARDAITGQFVSLDEAEKRPDTTIVETAPRKPKAKPKGK